MDKQILTQTETTTDSEVVCADRTSQTKYWRRRSSTRLAGRGSIVPVHRVVSFIAAVAAAAVAATGGVAAGASPLQSAGETPHVIASPAQVAGSGLSDGMSVLAADDSGNVFGDDSTIGSGSISWLGSTASGYLPQKDVFLSNPPMANATYVDGLTTDASGNIYATTGSSVVELAKDPSGYSSATTLPFGGITDATGIAVDTSGDVFVNNDGVVDELTKAVNGYGPQVTLGFSGISIDAGPAVDNAGNVYVFGVVGSADTIEELPKIPAGFGSQVTINLPSAFSWAQSLAVDGAGDVFVSGIRFSDVTLSYTSILAELPGVGGGHGAWETTDIAAGSDDYSVASSTSGHVYLYGPFLNTLEMTGTSPSYSSPQILPYYSFVQTNEQFVMDSSKDLYILSNVSLGDAENPDYVVELKDEAGTYIAEVLPLTGLGDRAGSIAVDPAGDLYVESETSGSDTWAVDEFPLSLGAFGGPVSVPFTGASNTGLEGSDPMTVDASGDVFVVDGGTAVLEMPKSGAVFGAQETLPFTGASADFSTIGTDAAGDVFASYTGSVFELPKQGSWFGSQVTATNVGFFDPVAFDSAGNLFTSSYDAETDTEAIVEIPLERCRLRRKYNHCGVVERL